MKKVLQIILHILGFPLLIALVIIFSLNMFKLGISYGVMAFVGLIITVVMAIIYYLVFFLMKKSGKKSIYKQTIVSIIVAAVCLGGLWIFIDVALPDFLADATSNTIYYEDLADDYNARAEVNKALLDDFIKLNFENGNLSKKKLSVYLEEGYRNEEVQKLIETNFQSIDKDGYATFVGPWIDFANNDRMTIPTLVHLLFNKRDLEEMPFLIVVGEEMQDDPVTWTVLDMAGDEMVFDLGEDGMGVLDSVMAGAIDFMFRGAIDKILVAVTNGLSSEDVVGAPIYLKLENGSVLKIIPSNSQRGVLDYMKMAWLDSNSMIIMITALFSIRKLFLIFAGVLIITTYAIGLLREEQTGKDYGDDVNGSEKKSKKSKSSNSADANLPNEKVATDRYYGNKSNSYVVIREGEELNMEKMTQQLLYDAQKGIIKRYDAATFLET